MFFFAIDQPELTSERRIIMGLIADFFARSSETFSQFSSSRSLYIDGLKMRAFWSNSLKSESKQKQHKLV